MTSSRERQQRAAARARLAREMAERQAASKKRRQRTIAGGAAAALLLVVAGTVWAVAALTGDDAETSPVADPTETPASTADPSAPPDPDAEPGECAWLPEDPSMPGFDQLDDVGTPPPDEPREGTSMMAIETNRGLIEIEMDVAAIPCTAASLSYLAGEEYYDDSICHRLTTEGAGISVLQCGDPTGTGGGGPTYRFGEENLPVDQDPTYPEGVVAMAKRTDPQSTGSQFFLVYEDTELPPDYTVVGTVTEGMDIVEEVAAGGASDENGESTPDGAPNEELRIETLRISDPE